jgi:hypothetical protein
MKYFLLFIPFLSFGVTPTKVNLKIGTSGYVTIDGNNYPRGQVYSYYSVLGNGDTSLQISGLGLSIGGRTSQYFLNGDGDDLPFTSMTDLKLWMDTYFEATATSGSISVGQTVTGADPNGVLFADNDCALRTVNNFTYSDGDGYPSINGSRVITAAIIGDYSNSINGSLTFGLTDVCYNNDCTNCSNYSYGNLTNIPAFAPVATSGSYDDLDNRIIISGATASGNGTTTFSFNVGVNYSYILVQSNTPATAKIIGCSIATGTVTCTTTVNTAVGVNNISVTFLAKQ